MFTTDLVWAGSVRKSKILIPTSKVSFLLTSLTSPSYKSVYFCSCLESSIVHRSFKTFSLEAMRLRIEGIDRLRYSLLYDSRALLTAKCSKEVSRNANITGHFNSEAKENESIKALSW